MTEPTEARQDELAGVREKFARILYYRDYFDEDVWEKEQPSIKYHYYVDADHILDSLTVSSGGTCPECKGEGEIFHRGVIDTLKAWSRCTACNGTGVVEKTLGEIINGFAKGEEGENKTKR